MSTLLDHCIDELYMGAISSARQRTTSITGKFADTAARAVFERQLKKNNPLLYETVYDKDVVNMMAKMGIDKPRNGVELANWINLLAKEYRQKASEKKIVISKMSNAYNSIVRGANAAISSDIFNAASQVNVN